MLNWPSGKISTEALSDGQYLTMMVNLTLMVSDHTKCMIYVILYTHIENIKNLFNGPAGLFYFWDMHCGLFPKKNSKIC